MINPDRRFERFKNPPMKGNIDFGIKANLTLEEKIKRLKKLLELAEQNKDSNGIKLYREQLQKLENKQGSDRQRKVKASTQKEVNEKDVMILEEQKDIKKQKNKKILLYVAVAVAGFFAYKKLFKK